MPDLKNIDLKELFKKKGNKSKSKDTKFGNSLTKFFEKNPKMKIIIPIMLILIAAGVTVGIVVVNSSVDTEVKEQPSVSAKTVEVLPIAEGRTQEAVPQNANPFSEDVIANAKLRGILYNSNGYRTVIIETQYAAYTLQVGDYVGSSQWLTSDITDSSVTFTLGDKSRTISMS